MGIEDSRQPQRATPCKDRFVNTPNPAPDERANGWRPEYPNPSAGWDTPDPAAPPQESPAQSPGTPWQPPDAGQQGQPGEPGVPAVGRAYVPAPPFPTGEPLVRMPEITAAVAVALLLSVIGFPLGWLWSSIAPHTPVQMISGGAVLSQPEQEQLIADEGWYLILTVLTGIVVASLAWALLRRYRGVPVALGLAVGGVIGGAITAWFGHSIGNAHFKELVNHAPVGTNFSAPVSLRVKQMGWWHHFLPYARGDVLALAITAVVIYLLLAAFSAFPSLRGPDPTPLTNVGGPGDGYPGEAYPTASQVGHYGDAGPGQVSSDS
jgi:hypothetical protein